MAHPQLRTLHSKLAVPTVLGATIGTSMIAKVNTALVSFLALLLLLTSWRFFRLLRGEQKLLSTKDKKN